MRWYYWLIVVEAVVWYACGFGAPPFSFVSWQHRLPVLLLLPVAILAEAGAAAFFAPRDEAGRAIGWGCAAAFGTMPAWYIFVVLFSQD